MFRRRYRNMNAAQCVNRFAKIVARLGLFFVFFQAGDLQPKLRFFPNRLKRRVEPDTWTTVLVDQIAICVFDPRAAAERDHTCLARLQQFAQCIRFDMRESGLAVFGDELGGSSASCAVIHSSRSTITTLRRRASARATLLLPQPIKPVMTIGRVSFHLCASDSSSGKNSGNEIATHSAPAISVSPSAIRAATEKAIAIR